MIDETADEAAERMARVSESVPFWLDFSATPDLYEALLSAMTVEVGMKTSIHMAEAFRGGFPPPENIDWPPWFKAGWSALKKARGE